MSQLDLCEVGFAYPRGFELYPLSLSIRENSIFGVLGPNGSGKSTLLQLLSGLLAPATGMIRLDGKELANYSVRHRAQKISVIPPDNYFEFPFRVSEVVEMGRYPYLGRLQSLASEDVQWIQRARRLTEIEAFWERPISELSSGERQRVLIARAVAQAPSILLLDEPSTHLDIHHQVAIFRMLKKFSGDFGTTIIVVLHDLALADAFCQEVALLSAGRLVQVGRPEQVVTTATLRHVWGADVRVHRGSDGRASLSFHLDDAGIQPREDRL